MKWVNWMLDREVIEKIIYFTEEEINNLNGKNKIDKSIFLNNYSNIIDYHKLFLGDEEFLVRKHARFCEYPKHKHNYIELVYVYSGKMIQNIDDIKVTLYEGELLLLNKNVEHSIEFANENDIIFNFIIKPNFLDFLSGMLDSDNEISRFIFNILYSYENDGEFLVFKTQNNYMIKDSIEKIINCLYAGGMTRTFELKLLLGLLLAELMHYPNDLETYSFNTYEKKILNYILQYIVSCYKTANLKELSEKINLPKYSICKIVKEKTGKTFVELLQQERLNNALKLIESTDMSIYDIVIEVGYESQTHFYKLFKQKYGITPSQYRNKMINVQN